MTHNFGASPAFHAVPRARPRPWRTGNSLRRGATRVWANHFKWEHTSTPFNRSLFSIPAVRRKTWFQAIRMIHNWRLSEYIVCFSTGITLHFFFEKTGPLQKTTRLNGTRSTMNYFCWMWLNDIAFRPRQPFWKRFELCHVSKMCCDAATNLP